MLTMKWSLIVSLNSLCPSSWEFGSSLHLCVFLLSWFFPNIAYSDTIKDIEL
ncbi:hypothetical protein AALP_AA2G159700 [Arabis alpina]|uniref:Uncharacterized protein n=1 Tax=Arabis alpina TaxID=50452 RepID=A0A087HHT3_ARAAL|nr:hypothetical protein AALP_AA2G159700 [Arabis alpina]